MSPIPFSRDSIEQKNNNKQTRKWLIQYVIPTELRCCRGYSGLEWFYCFGMVRLPYCYYFSSVLKKLYNPIILFKLYYTQLLPRSSTYFLIDLCSLKTSYVVFAMSLKQTQDSFLVNNFINWENNILSRLFLSESNLTVWNWSFQRLTIELLLVPFEFYWSSSLSISLYKSFTQANGPKDKKRLTTPLL